MSAWFRSKAFTPPPGPLHVVDNRTFLLGLDRLVRESMAAKEKEELLACAEQVVAVAGVIPAHVPIEGHYSDDPRLGRYFALMRCVQSLDAHAYGRTIRALPEFQRLLQVASSPLFGQPVHEGKLLPRGRDSLSAALISLPVDKWTVEDLLHRAREHAVRADDVSLVGLACRIGDPLCVTALRETVVLYAELVSTGISVPTFSWQVTPELAACASKTIAIANELFAADIPAPDPRSSSIYFYAAQRNHVIGRCVCVGRDEGSGRYYHWAIARSGVVSEFWDTDICSSARYRALCGIKR